MLFQILAQQYHVLAKHCCTSKGHRGKASGWMQPQSICNSSAGMQQWFHSRTKGTKKVIERQIKYRYVLGYNLKHPPMDIPQVCLCSSLLMDYFSFIEKTPLHSCWPSTFFISQTQPQPRTCTVPHPYLARVRAHIEVRAGLEWTGWLSVKQTVQYLDLLWREQLPSHLLPEEVPPTVAMPVSQRWLLQTCAEKDGGYKVEKSRVILRNKRKGVDKDTEDVIGTRGERKNETNHWCGEVWAKYGLNDS